VGRQRDHKLMATQPKPKPKPKPDDDDDAAVIEEPPETDTNASGISLTDRMDAMFTSLTGLIERVEKLEERQNAPPIGLGKRP
jgi:hypothetical protein